MANYIKYGGLMTASLLFLFWGIHVLLGAYRQNDPFAFMIIFFAANFIILISTTLLIGFAVRLWRERGLKKDLENHKEPAPPA